MGDPGTETAVHPAPPVRRLRRIGDVLVERGVITPAQLESAVRHQKQHARSARLGHILVDLGFATRSQIVREVALHLGCPFVEVEAGMIQPGALRALPAAFLEKHNLLPLVVAEGWITVAMEQFNDPFVLSDIARRSGMRVQAVAADPDAIRAARNAALAGTGQSDQAPRSSLDSILGQVGVNDLQVVEESREDESDLEASATESPIVKLVNLIITRAVELQASDIHIEPDETHFQVRYRVDGELVPGERPSRRHLAAVVSRIKILASMDIAERRLPQDGGLAVSLQSHSIDLRVSTMATRQGEKVVMRIMDHSADIRPLEELGLDGPMLRCLRRVLNEPHGLALVTGPTGSGKSTTLYSALSEMSSDRYNTSTIEDPVERRLKGVNQFQVHEQSGFTFARALRSLLRQDPDILMVGEIRDSETARLATEAALTGHLVLSTLHTNDAAAAVPRLVSMGTERFMVAATLRAVLAQRLVRRICPSCRKASVMSNHHRRVLDGLLGRSSAGIRAHEGEGCAKCGGRGSVGRIGVFDLLVLDEDRLARALSQADAFRSDMVIDQREMPGLLADGIAKVDRGLIDVGSLLELVCQTAGGEHNTTAARKENSNGNV